MNEIDLLAVMRQRLVDNPAPAFARAVQWLQDEGRDTSELESFATDFDFYDDYGIVISDFSVAKQDAERDASIIAEKRYNNEGNVNLEDTFTYTKTTQSSFTFKFTEGLKIGTKVTTEAKIPIVNVGGKVEISGEFTFGAEQSWTTVKTETFSDSLKIQVPPHSTVEAVATLSTEHGSFSFSALATATATRTNVWVTFKLKHGKGYTERLIPLGVLLPSEADRQVGVSGTLADSLGISVNVDTRNLTAHGAAEVFDIPFRPSAVPAVEHIPA